MAEPKIGDKRGWDELTQTGYKWQDTIHGKRWVQYYHGKPTDSRGFIDLFSGSKLQSAFANRNEERIAESRKGKTQIQTARGSRWVNDPDVSSGDEEPPAPSGISFQDTMGYEPKGEMKSMFEAYFNDLDTGFFSDQNETAYMSLKDVYGIVNQQQLTEDNQTFTNTPDPKTYTTWDSETDKEETGTVGDEAWKADMRSEQEIAREEWESKSSNTPAAKAFEEGTGQQKKDWGDLRWEARKRHKKLFEYNTDKEE